MSHQVINIFIGKAKTELAEHAAGAMLMGTSDLFQYGVAAGKYRGILFALELLEQCMRDDLEKEQNL